MIPKLHSVSLESQDACLEDALLIAEATRASYFLGDVLQSGSGFWLWFTNATPLLSVDAPGMIFVLRIVCPPQAAHGTSVDCIPMPPIMSPHHRPSSAIISHLPRVIFASSPHHLPLSSGHHPHPLPSAANHFQCSLYSLPMTRVALHVPKSAHGSPCLHTARLQQFSLPPFIPVSQRCRCACMCIWSRFLDVWMCLPVFACVCVCMFIAYCCIVLRVPLCCVY